MPDLHPAGGFEYFLFLWSSPRKAYSYLGILPKSQGKKVFEFNSF
jgi:hypothetical protein